ncbi:phosphate ABC transporter substrate-binding protein [Teredinibacter franksiae]|uniref:phosphate ABC transporter substrate-binding protein n=1 Tax=Teredinibacter franksiae TaxID=2761453 RepID=UPI0016255A7D|nr:phosphate ABC transporter substrate-binding protein [Teredinibacter franksiae]
MKMVFSVKPVINGILLMMLVLSAVVQAEVAVVVHPSNTNEFKRADIAKIYLGQRKVYADKSRALPVNQAEGSLISAAFAKSVLKKNNRQLKAYWAQQIFTGGSTPPSTVASDAEVKRLVAEDPAKIGYMEASSVDESVRVVYTF